MRLPPIAGTSLANLLTPSLLVSLPVLERNEAACRDLLRGTGVALRPHAKAHKSSGFARWLISRAGDEISGLCAQTVAEAEVMVGTAQCKDVLLTNEVLGGQKLQRLARLAASHPDATIGVLVDAPEQIEAYSAAIAATSEPSASLAAYVEIVRRHSLAPARLPLAIAHALWLPWRVAGLWTGPVRRGAGVARRVAEAVAEAGRTRFHVPSAAEAVEVPGNDRGRLRIFTS